MIDRKNSWIQLASGRQFFPLDPNPDDLTIEDIAHALSRVSRFGGHTLGSVGYSVAQHCVLVAQIVPPEFQLCALMHDAAEFCMGDIPSPIKKFFPDYLAAEDRLMRCIADKFCFQWPMPECVRRADKIMLATEQRDLMAEPPVPWTQTAGVEPMKSPIFPWNANYAKKMFLAEFWRIVG